jgi:hypothetical protein
MSSHYGYSSDEESIDVRVRRHRAPSPMRRPAPPPGPQYIQTVDIGRREERPRAYYQQGPVLLDPGRTLVRTRSRSRERRTSPPSQAPAPAPVAPVVIHNKIYNEQSDDDYSDDSRHRRHHRRNRSRSRYSRASSSDSHHSADARERWELEQARRQLEELKMAHESERKEGRLHKQYKEESELQRAKAELDEIKRREAKEKEERRIRKEMELKRLEEERKEEEEKDRREREEKRIRKEMELKRLEEERKEQEEKERREKERQAAIAEYKAKEAERIQKEKEEKERADKEYQRRLQEDLIRAGVDEKDIEAIIRKEKIKRDADNKKKDDERKHEQQQQVARPTYTRMSLKHLDIETLYYYKIDWEYDPVSLCYLANRRKHRRRGTDSRPQEPGFILIKRWVPEHEQDMLWAHTREIRLVRERERGDHKVVLKIDEGKKHKHRSKTEDDNFMWVAKKTDRRRSKSPGLLMYLAGGRPA